jgi:hypothetical protein
LLAKEGANAWFRTAHQKACSSEAQRAQTTELAVSSAKLHSSATRRSAVTEASGSDWPWLRLGLDLTIAALSALFVRAGYYELFVNIQGVHSARWADPWTMPKSALSIMTASALLSLVAALVLVIALREPGTASVVRLTRIVEMVAFLASLGAYAAWIADFMNNAGRFG